MNSGPLHDKILITEVGTRSIAEVLHEKDSALVGEANRFISHYWQVICSGSVC